MSNTSNTSMSSTTNSSRGNVSQSGNQSIGASSQKSLGGHHQPSPSSSQPHQQQNPNFDSNVISERVKNLATQIYQELKHIISRCNYDEDILSGLMPLIVRVLESLDLALIENQQLQVELELCKDDNEQLVIMFEKEKAAKRAIDKKLIESEYANDEERQQYQQKIESLDNTVKMYELKAKNASDQAARFEEKEAERKREYNKLHDRYTDLLKSHCDVVERVRHLTGNADNANLSSINVPQHMVSSGSSELMICDLSSAQQMARGKIRQDDVCELSEKLVTQTGAKQSTGSGTFKSWNAETELTLEDASLVVIEDMLDSHSKAGDGSSHNESDRGGAASEQETEHEKESENDSIAYTSMEKEFRKLIQENKDLLKTKNALNVVKDDLIAEVDRLTNEVSMYEQAVEQLNATKDQMKQKVSTLDAELRKTKEDLEKAKQKIRENNEEGVPYSQRKRFGRAEMAKVLMERNNYKERFMELQDAVRYTELVRANKVETEKRSGLWKFFSNLFGAQPLAIGGPGQTSLGSSRNASPVISYHGSLASAATAAGAPSDLIQSGSGSNQEALQSGVARGRVSGTNGPGAGSGSGGAGGSIRSTNQRLSSNSDLIVLMDSDMNVDRGRAFKDGNRVVLDAASGYIHAYGWSLPASSVKSLSGYSSSPDPGLGGAMSSASKVSAILGGTSSYVGSDPLSSTALGEVSISHSKLSGLQVPIPQYCRPLTGDSLGMKIWCATAIDLSGGEMPTERKQGKSVQLNTAHVTIAGEMSQPDDSSSSMVNISTSTPIKSSNQQALRILEQEVDQALKGETIDKVEPAAAVRDGIASLDLGIRRPILKTTTGSVLNALPFSDDTEELSTCVWICSTQHSRSKITIIDIKTKPNELLDSFYVPTFLYCIKSVPGTKLGDLLGISSAQTRASDSPQQQRASITLAMIEELISTQRSEFYKLIDVDLEADQRTRQSRTEARRQSAAVRKKDDNDESYLEKSLEQETNEAYQKLRAETTTEDDAEISRILDNNVSVGIATLQKLNDFVAHTQPQPDNSAENKADTIGDNQRQFQHPTTSNDDLNKEDSAYYQPISTHLSTVWMGGKDSVLYVHSAIGQWKDCVACVTLSDSILQICHHRGRVFVALADGTICVFFRDVDTKRWEFSKYLVMDINLMADVSCDVSDLDESNASSDFHVESPKHNKTDNLNDLHEEILDTSGNQTSGISQTVNITKTNKKAKSKVAGIRCLEIANKNLWIGYKNRILIVDPITMKLKHTFSVVPQADNQIRQIIAMKDGVFCCLRSDLILRLYSSLRPYQHIHNIDIEPVVTRLISPKTFVISHITAMKVAGNTLWIGNAHGIILTIPCKLVPQISETPMPSRSGGFEESPSNLSIARFVPKCDITNAQISFHGHKDAVKFFTNAHNLMLSGGQGYLDFRLDMDDQSKSISDKSHLILWQLPQ